MVDLALEHARRAELNRAHRKTGAADSSENKTSTNTVKEIPLIEAGLLAAALAPLDLFVYALAFVPIVGPVVGLLVGLVGKSIIIIWLICKRALNFDTIVKSGWLFLCTSAGFVIGFTLRQRAAALLQKTPAAGVAQKL